MIKRVFRENLGSIRGRGWKSKSEGGCRERLMLHARDQLVISTYSGCHCDVGWGMVERRIIGVEAVQSFADEDQISTHVTNHVIPGSVYFARYINFLTLEMNPPLFYRWFRMFFANNQKLTLPGRVFKRCSERVMLTSLQLNSLFLKDSLTRNIGTAEHYGRSSLISELR